MSHIRLRRAARGAVAAFCLLWAVSFTASAQVSIGVGVALPGVRIGINIPAYPQLAPIPGYPVYYAPDADANLFFYNGMYWAFADNAWYSSSWYNGPWYMVPPEEVPVFILRVPVRFYRRPPMFFRGWNRYAAPRWGEHWGPRWERRRPGWDRWNHRDVPPRAPLPQYQRQYPPARYPGPQEQRNLQNRYYHYRQEGRPGWQQQHQRNMPPHGNMPPQRNEHNMQQRGERDRHRGEHPPR